MCCEKARTGSEAIPAGSGLGLSICSSLADVPQTAISFDYRPILQFVIFAVLNTPPNFFWLEFLEYAFPSQVPVASKPPRDTAAPSEYDVRNMDEKEMNELQHPTRPAVETKLSWTHTLIKFTLDQTLGATFNTVAFIAGMAVIKGQRDQAQIWAIVQRVSAAAEPPPSAVSRLTSRRMHGR